MGRFWSGLILALAAVVGGCSKPEPPAPHLPPVTVIFSQANTTDPWHRMYEKEMAASAQQHASDIKFSEMDAGGSADKQISQIKDAIAQKPRVLMVSPVSESVLQALGDAHNAGIFVFLLDNYVKGSKADSYYGANVISTGSDMATFYARGMRLKGTILVIPGPASSKTASDAKLGIDLGIKKFGKQLEEVVADDCEGSEEKAKTFVASYLQAKKPVDAVFAVNDDMALGAAEAAKAANVKLPYIFGIGACQKKTFDAIADGTIFATFSVPPGGPVAMDAVPDMAKGIMPPQRSFVPDDEIRKDTMETYLKQHPILGD